MGSVNLTVLDIGHGNCSLIQSDGSLTIIDAAQGPDVLDILSSKGIVVVDDIVISHADADHIGGSTSILLDPNIAVRRVHLNPDGDRQTATWGDFRTALAIARISHDTKVVTAINRDTPNIIYDDYQLEILAPSPIDCMTGPGSTGINGGRLDANSMSVVLRLIHNNEKIALIPGDMDADSLEYLKGEMQCLDAKILVFPHHGGLPRSNNPLEFSEELCGLVNPDLIIFSNSRFKHDNPRTEIIAGAKRSNCNAHLACTQLSKACCAEENHLSNTHLAATFPSKGSKKNHSCAGSITININGASTDVSAPLAAHLEYINNFNDRKCL